MPSTPQPLTRELKLKAALQLGQLSLVLAALILYPAASQPAGLYEIRVWGLYAVYWIFFALGSIRRLLKFGDLAPRCEKLDLHAMSQFILEDVTIEKCAGVDHVWVQLSVAHEHDATIRTHCMLHSCAVQVPGQTAEQLERPHEPCTVHRHGCDAALGTYSSLHWAGLVLCRPHPGMYFTMKTAVNVALYRH